MSEELNINLPSSLTESEDYKNLNSKQRSSLAARLHHCREVAAKGRSAASVRDAGLLDVIDEIELDALSIMGSFSDVENTASPYQIHSSWTFECDRQGKATSMVANAANFLATSRIGVEASPDDARRWLESWAEVLHLTLNRLAATSSFTEAVVQLIVADGLISSYLVFAATFRLSRLIQ